MNQLLDDLKHGAERDVERKHLLRAVHLKVDAHWMTKPGGRGCGGLGASLDGGGR
jgi:hypothetical protein